MRDQDQRKAPGRELRQRGQERFGVTRREDRGRLVEQEGAGPPVEDLDELDPLALGHAEVLDRAVRVDRQAARRRQLIDTPAGHAQVDAPPSGRLRSQDDVLEHAQVVRQHGVLMHHADPGPDGGPGRPEAHDRPVDADGPGVGAEDPGEHLHQRRLPGAVFPRQGMDLPGADDQRGAVVGHDARIALDDPLEEYQGDGLDRLRGCWGR